MNLFYKISDVSDGSMKSTDKNYASVLPIRKKFLNTIAIKPSDTTLVQVTYETDNFCRYFSLARLDRGDGIVTDASIEADALVVTEPGHALFLPLADCIGAVIYDSSKNILMMSHLGRHNLEQHSGTNSIKYLIEKHGVNPNNLSVWLSPAAGKKSYPLYAFNGRGLRDVAIEQLTATGVLTSKITRSSIDTTTSTDHYSHSEYIKGNHDIDGRFAIVAVIR